MRQVETKNGIARLENCHVGRGIGLRAGVRLDVGKLRAEYLFGTIAREIFYNVGILAAAVVASPWIAFGIFVGEDRSGGFEHCFGDEVLAGNHLQAFVLAEGFVVNGGGYFGVGLGQGKGHAISHTVNFTARFSLAPAQSQFASLEAMPRIGCTVEAKRFALIAAAFAPPHRAHDRFCCLPGRR